LGVIYLYNYIIFIIISYVYLYLWRSEKAAKLQNNEMEYHNCDMYDILKYYCPLIIEWVIFKMNFVERGITTK